MPKSPISYGLRTEPDYVVLAEGDLEVHRAPRIRFADEGGDSDALSDSMRVVVATLSIPV
jgi:hypothetical protein